MGTNGLCGTFYHIVGYNRTFGHDVSYNKYIDIQLDAGFPQREGTITLTDGDSSFYGAFGSEDTVTLRSEYGVQIKNINIKIYSKDDDLILKAFMGGSTQEFLLCDVEDSDPFSEMISEDPLDPEL